MKKHPVDDLFKRRLADLNKKPSESAWLRIQENTEARRRRPAVWIWYAAAGVVLAVTAGYLVWENNRNGLIEPIGNKKIVASATKAEKIAQLKKDNLNNGDEIPAEKREELLPDVRKSTADKDEHIAKQVPAYGEESAIVKAETPIAAVEKVSIVPNTVSEIDPPKVPEVASLKPSAGGNDLPETDKAKSEPAITIVVAVESDENEMGQKPKTSRFSRVFRQLKNARAGEKVDWEEVGFNPKNLVARVDDRLRTKEERASERNQNPKERTKL